MAVLHFTQNLRRHTDCPSCTLEAESVGTLFSRYFEQYPNVRGFILDDQGKVRKHVKILVNGGNLQDRNTLSDPLDETSEVHVFQALSGG